MFFYDIESTAVESTAVILSAGIVFANGTESVQELLDKSLFVKFDMQEQIKMKRVIDRSTLDWWSKQGKYQQERSLAPRKDDLSAVDGLTKLLEYRKKYDPEGKALVWTRGSLDQMATESLCRMVDVEPFAKYNMFRDVRTAIDLLKETAKNGYCSLPENAMEGLTLVKHEPVHDCILDVLYMYRGI